MWTGLLAIALIVPPAQAQLGQQTPLLDDGVRHGATSGSPASARLPLLPAGMNETVVNVPAGAPGEGIELETTLFKPDGPGPFPVVIFNHGKERGDPRLQARSRPVSFAREFVRRGYLVVAPNREGFAHSGGTYGEQLCDISDNGIEQARDIAATVLYLKQLPYADSSRVLVAGASQGGLATIAYGIDPAPGVRGLINFNGGLRQDSCREWQEAMIDAFAHYGHYSRLPTLWYYGDNDRFWPQPLARQLLASYVNAGGQARLIDFGDYKDNAHRLVGDRDAVPIWWPATEAFLRGVGLPATVLYREPDANLPLASHFAPVTSVNAVPYLDAEGRAAYLDFLRQYDSRAFAISPSGAWSWAEGGDDPISVALDNCQRNSRDPCRLYAVNHVVVWTAH